MPLSPKDLATAFTQKMKASGLSAATVKKLQYQPYTGEQVKAAFPLLPAHRAGFSLPYFSLQGKKTGFYRFRYLEYRDAHGFGALVDPLKPLRYAQPPDTVNELYLPPLFDWASVAKQTDQPLIITEGELKAACACAVELPTIGLGGVWNWKTATLPVLPQFKEFKWQDRRVCICFDSDAASNSQVLQAENALARALLQLGAQPHLARLPALSKEGKTGLDDYIVARGAELFKRDVLSAAEPWKAWEELHKLNEEVLYVEDPGLIAKVDTLQRMAPRAFIEHAFATRVYNEIKVTAKGEKTEEKSAAKEWIKWPHRACVKRIVYLPGERRVTDAGELNAWRGWGVEPKKGAVKPWNELIDYLFKDTKLAAWFEQWLAYPLQHPGTKLYSAAVLWGNHHGTGKSLVGYTMFKLYGANATEIGDRDLYSSHNEWAENKQFVMGDEITGGDKRHTADRMKSMITQTELRLNPKYIPSYTVRDCINYYFTSNHPDAFFLEDNDRRFFIHEVVGRPMPQEFYTRYLAWLGAGGAAALFYYLLQLPLAGFNPAGHALVTASKNEMIDAGRSDVGVWVAALRENADHLLKVAGAPVAFKLWTTRELHNLYDPEQRTKVTANGLARELRRGGFNKVCQGAGVRTEKEGQQRLWAIRDAEKLLGLSAMEVGALYDAERNGAKKRRKY